MNEVSGRQETVFDGGDAVDRGASLVELIDAMKAEIVTLDTRKAELLAQLKGVRDGLKGLGRGGARKASTAARKRTPKAPKAAQES